MSKRALIALCITVMLGTLVQLATADGKQWTVNFAEGQWDTGSWTPLRLPLHPEVQTLIQRPDCLGTDSFTDEQKKAHLDNVLLMTDTGITEGQFEVVFSIGPERGTAPGIFLSPTYTDDALETGIAVFVADYTMAVWMVHTDPETRETGYTHLVRVNRYREPGVQHVLRCRYSNARKSIALQVDDSDVVMLRLPEFEINSEIGIWGCHGTCNFYSVAITSEGTLPWKAEAPVTAAEE